MKGIKELVIKILIVASTVFLAFPAFSAEGASDSSAWACKKIQEHL